ncbi:OsmC family protein [Streptomyces sp. NPDC050549]|uniref:OsmC family protein n=1 Tax=Streptomyces sp. NPDC050549 TaxID=3155406 RepID=UPI00343DB793
MTATSPTRDSRFPYSAHSVTASPGRIEVAHVSDHLFAALVRGHELTVDEPVEAGGDNDGPTAVELFVTSLASCAACDAVRFLRLLHLPYDQLRVEADFATAQDGAPRLLSVRIRILLPAPLNPVLRETLCAVVGRCAVHNTLRVPPEVTVEFG